MWQQPIVYKVRGCGMKEIPIIKALEIEKFSNETPAIAWWKQDLNSAFIDANEACRTGLLGIKEVNGLTVSELPNKLAEFAPVFRNQEERLLTLEKPLKTLEIHPCVDNVWKIMLTVRKPLYAEEETNRRLIGIEGCGVDITHRFLEVAHLLSSSSTPRFNAEVIIGDAGQKLQLLQSSYVLSPDYASIKLPKRQAECLFLLLHRKTSKRIAQILNLSAETIEDYIDVLKFKFSVQNRRELVDKAIAQGFLNVIPESLFNEKLAVILREK